MPHAFFVHFYAAGRKGWSDGIGPFRTRAEAEAAGNDELCRVIAIEPAARDEGMDWAVRFTIAKAYWPARCPIKRYENGRFTW